MQLPKAVTRRLTAAHQIAGDAGGEDAKQRQRSTCAVPRGPGKQKSDGNGHFERRKQNAEGLGKPQGQPKVAQPLSGFFSVGQLGNSRHQKDHCQQQPHCQLREFSEQQCSTPGVQNGKWLW